MRPLKIGDLEIKIPIIQGGMGVAISLSGLASAVANQGGIGVISAAGIGMREPGFEKNLRQANRNALIREIQTARKKSNGVIGVNLMVALSDYDELLKIAVEEKVDLVFMGAGLPLKLPEFVFEQGFENIHTKFVPKVSSAKAAKLVFQYWHQKFNHIPDAVVVEGPLAGGHLGFSMKELTENPVPLSELIKETVAAMIPFEELYHKSIPVIAAGGIYTGSDIVSIFEAGAKAVKMGTRFVATHECDADLAFKESYLNSIKEDILLINSPVGLPGRVINSDFVQQIKRGETKPFKCPWKCLKNCDYKQVPYCISKVLLNSAQGKMDIGFAFAGANAFRVNKIVSVKELFDELISEYEHALELKKHQNSFASAIRIAV
ncbi:MAG TPA: nitronate monooxygenase [Marinilabiliales bacterium]|nr:MAG: 2-nitropropane dioxygenase [Bacteroidetes bacterium GWA2_40_14]OFX58577.1 MAG: 2-nitropropane dioxygenase [Bacteroidetes bacterium GWC2_40_13]OFX75314.1 MAG: 2-nitropropane dioxygenase [Bacteroidetes bacterium GWD2_40_43]OFX88606.1 MAG: 2-nitropropane dioxygenase [Bacteroidetes bacterium GWE2_40_63]OFY20020.1 MAG: 2-nitropropane dioxygenase [Bacteroidetes bacterium GWF2_40_13]OFZ24077.1 MAG: 2-nitropropane dioxygenase [Bacteroidetes bacterium RIFOXYC2_FULL_40_12]HAM97270.1 nitronate m